MIGGQPHAPDEVLARAAASCASTPVLVAAALLAGDLDLSERAAHYATSTRDRQLVALAEAHLRGNADLLDVLVREHLSEHPDNLLAAWIAGRALPRPMTPVSTRPAHPRRQGPHRIADIEREHVMSDLRTAPHNTTATAPRGPVRTIGRWMLSFAGYPLGGYAAYLLIGRVDSIGSALAGGLLTGIILGAVQAWAMGPTRTRPLAWILGTGAGLMTGVAVGAAMVDYETDLRSLVVQGAVCGALVGVAQGALLYRRLGVLVMMWPLFLGGAFALGWAVTTSAGIDVDQQFTIFGSSGALVVALLTAVLPLALNSRRTASTGVVS
jgi:hypothetical protein